MKIKFYCILLLLLTYKITYCQDHIEISILTCDAGNKIYASFGHAAIRIVDKEKKIDQVYDFGTFNFKTPNFTYKFLKGNLQYQLSKRNGKKFIASYKYRNRSLVEQTLDLNADQKQKIIKRIEFLYQPENRKYRYSFIDKNCATDLRELLTLVGVTFRNNPLDESSRDLLDSCLEKKSWLRLGINNILSLKLSKKTTAYKSMFLPKCLKQEIDYAYLGDKKIVKSEQILNEYKPSKKIDINKICPPILVFIILLIIYLLGIQKPVEIITRLSVGICGIIITALWMFTECKEFQTNLNVLWCSPLQFVSLLISYKRNTIKQILEYIIIVSLVSAIIVWLVGIQGFDNAVIPLSVLMGLISYNNIKRLRI